jgi:arginase family enzyme
MRQYAVVEAPSVLGLRPTGVERLPDALLEAGLAERLRARRVGRVEPPPYGDRGDPKTLMQNPQGISAYTPRLADAVGEVLASGALMPAVDYRMPGGLSWRELHAMLRTALASPRAVGIEVAIFNPRLDHDGTAARAGGRSSQCIPSPS